MKSYWWPASILALSALGFAAMSHWRQPWPGDGLVASLIFIAYFVATDWLLILIARQDQPTATGRRLAKIILVLLLGAPTGGWALFFAWGLATVGDNLWMALPFGLGPALLVWPLVLVALVKLQRMKHGGRADQ